MKHKIIHPFTKQVFNLYSKQGKQLLKQYIVSYNNYIKLGGKKNTGTQIIKKRNITSKNKESIKISMIKLTKLTEELRTTEDPRIGANNTNTLQTVDNFIEKYNQFIELMKIANTKKLKTKKDKEIIKNAKEVDNKLKTKFVNLI